MNTDPVLCYVKNNWAFFTTQPLADQWGDDWDDAPYEHNAGEPYEFNEHDAKDGKTPWTITKVAWDGCFEQPSSLYRNSPYSVQMINAGCVAWLYTEYHSPSLFSIQAGTPLSRFIDLIRQGGGNVYLAAKE